MKNISKTSLRMKILDLQYINGNVFLNELSVTTN